MILQYLVSSLVLYDAFNETMSHKGTSSTIQEQQLLFKWPGEIDQPYIENVNFMYYRTIFIFPF